METLVKQTFVQHGNFCLSLKENFNQCFTVPYISYLFDAFCLWKMQKYFPTSLPKPGVKDVLNLAFGYTVTPFFKES